jgi:hypothetical protein
MYYDITYAIYYDITYDFYFKVYNERNFWRNWHKFLREISSC